MLNHIHIRDFAIIDEVDLDLGPGMTVLTGETGAGKSILLDALGLTLGDRADSDMVRHGSERAEIHVEFSLQELPEVEKWLQEQEMDEGGECQLRRTISADGRSRAYINGRPATLQLLKQLGEKLVDIHGQHEHQSLMRKESQRQLLDDYADNAALLRQLVEHFGNWRQLQSELERLSRANSDRDARLELLSFQVKELETLGLQEGELAKLEEEHDRLANANQLIEGCEFASNLLYDNDDGAVHSLLGQISQRLEGMGQYDGALAPINEMVNSAAIQVQEAASELRHHLDSLELDPSRLQEVEQRLSSVHDLARKHHIAPPELHLLLPRLSEELQGLQDADITLDRLKQEIDDIAKAYKAVASELSQRRHQAAGQLSAAVTTNMQELGMQGGRFEIQLTPLESSQLSASGMEQVEFMVSTNPGQPLKALSKVASGGELSRISLAIQVITAQVARIPTLIFDEVDVGIGGGIAEIVGRQLRTLGNRAQVMCVTHQPQVAALAHAHFQISKRHQDERTQTRIDVLNEGERVVEVARMLGGVEITSQTLSHAKEMIERSQAL